MLATRSGRTGEGSFVTVERAAGYRDASAAARARIAQLEQRVALLGSGGAPPHGLRSSSWARVLALGGVALSAMGIGAMAGNITAIRATDPAVVEVLPPAPPPSARSAPPDTKLTWYEPDPIWNARHGPWTLEIDGAPLLVGLLDRRGRGRGRGRGAREDGLHVAAFERATLRPRWIAGPFPGPRREEGVDVPPDRHHVVVVRDAVVVADSAGTLRVLDARTGGDRGSTLIRRGVQGACVAHGRIVLGFGAYGDRATLASLFPWERYEQQPFFFDPSTMAVTTAPLDHYCDPAPYCGPTHPDSCRSSLANERPPRAVSAWEGVELWRQGGRRIAVGTTAGLPAIVGWDQSTRSDQWERLIDVPERRSHDGSGWPSAAISERAFVYGFASERGPYHLVGFDTKTGARSFSVDLARSGRATHVPFVSIDGDDVFVPMNDELVVIDARTGRERGRLEAP